MKRKLFRGYDWESKSWRYGDLIYFAENPHIFKGKFPNNFEFFPVLEDSVGQYLHLNLGNHHLFEADIVRVHAVELSEKFGYGSYYLGKVIATRQCGVVLKSPLVFSGECVFLGKVRELIPVKPNTSTIVGNMFENELILNITNQQHLERVF